MGTERSGGHLVDWVKLWTTLHDDPGVLRLSDGAFRYYINAWSWCGHHETDGVFEVFGKHPRQVAELLGHGKFEPTDDPNKFAIHGWPGRQESSAKAAQRSARGKAAADARWNAERNAPSIAGGNTEKRREEKSIEEKTPPTPRGGSVYSPDFEAFWTLYPVHEGKGAAFVAYKKARKLATHDEIVSGVERYRKVLAAAPDRKVKWAQGWLNERRWQDDPNITADTDDYDSRLARGRALLGGTA